MNVWISSLVKKIFKPFHKLYRKILFQDLKNFYIHCYLISKDVAVLNEYLEVNNNSDSARRYIINAKYNLSKISPLYYVTLKYCINKFDNKLIEHDNLLIKQNGNHTYFSGVRFEVPGSHNGLYVNANVIIYKERNLPFTNFENKLFKYSFFFQDNYSKKLKKFLEEEKIKKILNVE